MATITRQRKTPEKSVVVTFNPKDKNASNFVDMMKLMDFLSVIDSPYDPEEEPQVDPLVKEIARSYAGVKSGKTKTRPIEELLSEL